MKIIKNAIDLTLLFFLCFTSYAFSEEDSSNPIIVDLSTESSLVPLYLFPFINENSSFDENYLTQLEKILTFDLNQNGTTNVIKQTKEKNVLGLNDKLENFGPMSAWKEKHILYLVKISIQNQSLKTYFIDVQAQSLKNIQPLSLSGNLSEDRKQMHRLSDIIHQALFGMEGIANTHFIFTIKTTNTQKGKDSLSEVWESDYDGGNPRQLTREISTCVAPIYLPPKKGNAVGGFLYVSYKLGQPKIFAASLKDGKQSRVSSMRGNQLMPAISRQRDKVAFICDITGNPDLFIQNFSPEKGAIGKPEQIFSAPLATQGSPSFHPDGTKIAFVSNKDGSPKIYVIQIPKARSLIKDIRATLISKRNRENTAPSWSADGKKIAYCSTTNGTRQIWYYDFETEKETQLTFGNGHKENPSWAPNSVHLVYNGVVEAGGDAGKKTTGKINQIFILNIHHVEPKQVTFGPGDKRFPNWEPRG